MSVIHTRLYSAPDGTVTGRVPHGVPPGQHDAEIVLEPVTAVVDQAVVRELIRSLQDELARLPVLDARLPDEIFGYDTNGLFGRW